MAGLAVQICKWQCEKKMPKKEIDGLGILAPQSGSASSAYPSVSRSSVISSSSGGGSSSVAGSSASTRASSSAPASHSGSAYSSNVRSSSDGGSSGMSSSTSLRPSSASSAHQSSSSAPASSRASSSDTPLNLGLVPVFARPRHRQRLLASRVAARLLHLVQAVLQRPSLGRPRLPRAQRLVPRLNHGPVVSRVPAAHPRRLLASRVAVARRQLPPLDILAVFAAPRPRSFQQFEFSTLQYRVFGIACQQLRLCLPVRQCFGISFQWLRLCFLGFSQFGAFKRSVKFRAPHLVFCRTSEQRIKLARQPVSLAVDPYLLMQVALDPTGTRPSDPYPTY
ncbi:hypothetical protein FB45DRAFT_873753 [Roridomyces roridus]|uniref:Uncharacterized protein n=1 Tax=Roridomyces roridus TaxID=1738132 RepID=A0AAD7B9Q5_9AGAR|nr:hypothetical protein FB45DRAFT_873753 [Roridomyces roridus]